MCIVPLYEKLCSLEVGHYAARLIYLNEIFACFPQATISNKIGATELNEFFLNSMPNSWSYQAFVQGFDCESILFKKYVNMF